MAFGDGDLGVFFADFSDIVQFAGMTATGTLDTPSEMFSHEGPAGIEEQQMLLTLPTNALNPIPLSRQAIVVNGQNYTVRDRQFLDDGRLMRLTLKVA